MIPDFATSGIAALQEPLVFLATGQAILDARAKDAYRRRLVEIDQDIEQAQATGDIERAAQSAAERAFLIRELSRAVGMSGRSPTSRIRIRTQVPGDPCAPHGDGPDQRPSPAARRASGPQYPYRHVLLPYQPDPRLRPVGFRGTGEKDTGFWTSGLNEL